ALRDTRFGPQGEGVADGDDVIAHPEVVGTPEGGRCEIGPFGPDQRQIVLLGGADDGGVGDGPVVEPDADRPAGGLDDVGVGEDQTVGGDHDAGSGPTEDAVVA